MDERQTVRNRVFDNSYEANYKRLTTKAGNADRQNRIKEVYNTTRELNGKYKSSSNFRNKQC